MIRKTGLAIIVITVCFLIGWLTYFGTMLFVDIIAGQVGDCNKAVHSCRHHESPNLETVGR